jgi:hypothetical protein
LVPEWKAFFDLNLISYVGLPRSSVPYIAY